jgi:hypothetical protein
VKAAARAWDSGAARIRFSVRETTCSESWSVNQQGVENGWPLGLNLEDKPFDHSSFAKNRRRLLEQQVSRQFFEAVVRQARQHHLLSWQHFTVDATLLGYWASMMSLRPCSDVDKPGSSGGSGLSNPEIDVWGQRRTNQTHFSPTDLEALMARKGQGRRTRLCFTGHVMMENRHGLAVDVELAAATGTSEWEATLVMLRRMSGRVRRHRCTLGADKGYDVHDFVAAYQDLRVTSHIARKDSYWSAAAVVQPAQTPGDHVSQRKRKRVEEIFGWTKTVGRGRKLRDLDVERNRLWAELTAAAYNLVGMGNPVAVPA